ncbi:N-acetylglucosamine kinase [Lacrimispora brassicae]
MNYIGIDGGGTKTLFRLSDENLNTIKEIELGTSHFGQVGYDRMKEILQQGINGLLKYSNGETVLSFGLAGYGEVVEIRRKIESVIKDVVLERKYVLHNDSQIAAFGALGGKEGIVMIAGTGSIAVAYKDGKWHRRGGLGYLIDDGGSAYDIGKKALKIYARMSEDLIEKDALFDMIMERYSLSKPMDLIGVMFDRVQTIRTETAGLAGLVYEASLAGSQNAEQLLQDAALEHSVYIKSLIKLFDQEVPVSYIGGVYRAGDKILKPLENHGIFMQHPVYDSCTGAVLLGKKVYCE